jgi:transcription antitermination factor NusG
VFCRIDQSKDLRIITTPGVVRILGLPNRPSYISDEEISSIRAIVECHLDYGPVPYLSIGQKVRITDGPLRGVTGSFMRIDDTETVVVSVEILKRSVAVQIAIREIGPELGQSQHHPEHVQSRLRSFSP